MLCQFCKHSHGQDVICPLDPTNYDAPEINLSPIRSAITAVQSSFNNGHVLQIEVEHDDVRVYLKEGYGKRRIDTGNGFEANLLEAREQATAPKKG
jgi:hypothetical protein